MGNLADGLFKDPGKEVMTLAAQKLILADTVLPLAAINRSVGFSIIN